ncbi:MAG: asparaginase [Candidatus Marinimicrobia bacterium]|jgi:L-asparaginase II|nr:asparaginase [Candidatus Neomarinimicrobiota bacterium]MDP6611385.1 asparaginase [Candidatus Neomarinimicrobiota bacterium]|tara:strand:- start:5094 stop:6074 length:981 start_codon:yes stop_codon:yes gene_type:complete
MPILSKVMRGDFIESIHVAYGATVDAEGEIVFSTGDPHYLTGVRSSLKPFQAAATVKSGAVDAADFSEDELALMCASHNGEAIHVKTVQSMLDKLEYTTDQLKCGRHAPYDRESHESLIKNDGEMSPLHNNCSGKHAGMLALSKFLAVDPKDYIHKKHPVQRAIFAQVKEYTGLDQLSTAIDGCSAPTPFLTLALTAKLFQQLASGSYPELDKLYRAMTAYPYLVAGKGRFDTDFISAMSGRAVCKVGGEAIRGFGIRNSDGTILGCAVKVLDGNMRALHPASMAFLNEMDLLTHEENKALQQYREPILKNHRKIQVGKISTGIDI